MQVRQLKKMQITFLSVSLTSYPISVSGVHGTLPLFHHMPSWLGGKSSIGTSLLYLNDD